MTKAQYLSWFDEVVRPTEPTFLRVPAEKLDFQLTAKSFSVGQLLAHIPLSLLFLAKVIRRDELPYKSMREILVHNRRQNILGVDAAVSTLREAIGGFKGAVDSLSEEQFQSDMLDTPQLGRVHYWRYCAFALEHHIHHFMELHLSLKVLGVDVNTKTLYAG
ncbi:DinB family protein [Sphingobacteriales bacterium CHB3]|nr:DinB family protein [Sphingobacteriales bacterium CHB3]